MSLAIFADTITALSTPLGTSALATLRLCGTDAIAIAARCIESPEKIFTLLGGDSFYTNVANSDGHIDDIVVTVWRAPRSYTGEDIVEFHTHGSPVIVDLIQRQLIAGGARLAEAGEFSRRAFINGKMCLEDLERTVMRLGASSEGSLSKIEKFLHAKYDKLHSIYNDIISLVARVNAEIDFGESDHVELENFSSYVNEIQAKLDRFLAQSVNEQLNKGYFSIAFTGLPNVGKSSIFNALLRYERSIVSDMPGTTRDYVEAFIMLEGFRVKLIDTAGLRDPGDEIESRGISLGAHAADNSDITLYVTGPESRAAQGSQGEIIIHNKCDLDRFANGICISAKTGEGIPKFVDILKSRISELETARTGYVIGESEVRTITSIKHILDNLLLSNELAIIAEELRSAADKVASLFGLNVTEDSLNYIFNKMCIGK